MKKIILSAIPLILLLAFFLPGILVKVKIECRSQYGDCPREVVDRIGGLNGKNMSVARRELKKELKSNFLVSAFTVQFKLPNILRVDLIVKKPVYALKKAESDVLALVDREGTVLAVSNQAFTPVVITKGNLLEAGEKVNEKDLSALELMDGVYKMYQTSTGNIEGDTLLVELPGPIRVIFPLAGTDRNMLLGSLRLIYSNIRDDKGTILYSQIDLRYKNPVLR